MLTTANGRNRLLGDGISPRVKQWFWWARPVSLVLEASTYSVYRFWEPSIQFWEPSDHFFMYVNLLMFIGFILVFIYVFFFQIRVDFWIEAKRFLHTYWTFFRYTIFLKNILNICQIHIEHFYLRAEHFPSTHWIFFQINVEHFFKSTMNILTIHGEHFFNTLWKLFINAMNILLKSVKHLFGVTNIF